VKIVQKYERGLVNASVVIPQNGATGANISENLGIRPTLRQDYQKW
jgi:hypothetical protein